MPMDAIASGVLPRISTPLSLTEPLSAGMKPVNKPNRVLLPAPFGPIRAVTLRAGTCRVTPRTAWIPPKLLTRSATSRSDSPVASSASTGPGPSAVSRTPGTGSPGSCSPASPPPVPWPGPGAARLTVNGATGAV